jgi:hypothetical protein
MVEQSDELPYDDASGNLRGTLAYRRGPPPRARARERPLDTPPITMADVDRRIGEWIGRESMVWARVIVERIAELQDDIDKGLIGKPGPRGEKGDQGLPGKLPAVRAWQEGQISYAFDVVAFGGSTFQARRDTAKTPGEGDDWLLLAQAGQDGAMPHICGTYEPNTKYRLLDICEVTGSSYIARKDSPGPCPGDDWELFASAGRTGGRGERGEAGVRGAPGERGAEGECGATIIAWDVDPERYAVIPVMSDGKQGPALELYKLFKQFALETR